MIGDNERGDVVFRTDACPPAAMTRLGLDPEAVTVAEIHGPSLPRLVSAYVLRNTAPASIAVAARVGPKGGGEASGTEVTLGTGVHPFSWRGHSLWAMQQVVGRPVGSNVGAAVYETLVLVSKGAGTGDVLTKMCNELVAESEQGTSGQYTMFRWDVHSQCWCMQGSRSARRVESVVLPAEKKRKLLEDLEEFLSAGTRRFYLSHGIPYRRSYLFHGVAGTGKTSLIQALAGLHERNVCLIQPTDPAFTDDMLKGAISNAPARSVIVMEDIDALFTRNRQNRGKSAVTFAGLLNALDGVGTPEGQLFMFTTNFREQLDDALVRDGRVDYHLRFDHATDEVIREMFVQFFPQSAGTTYPEQFIAALHSNVGSFVTTLTPAVLQHFFVVRHKLSLAEVVDSAGAIAVELRERSDSGSSSPVATDASPVPSTPPEVVADECGPAPSVCQMKTGKSWAPAVSSALLLNLMSVLCCAAAVGMVYVR